MKKIVIIIFLISAGMVAQRPNHERIKAFKTAHITQELNLTSAEAEKFWPIYNAFDEKLMALRMKERSEIFMKTRNEGLDSLTDDEANILIDRMLAMKATELEYRKELAENLRKVISPKKIILLHKAEESFKKMLLERLKERRGNRK